MRDKIQRVGCISEYTLGLGTFVVLFSSIFTIKLGICD